MHRRFTAVQCSVPIIWREVRREGKEKKHLTIPPLHSQKVPTRLLEGADRLRESWWTGRPVWNRQDFATLVCLCGDRQWPVLLIEASKRQNLRSAKQTTTLPPKTDGSRFLVEMGPTTASRKLSIDVEGGRREREREKGGEIKFCLVQNHGQCQLQTNQRLIQENAGSLQPVSSRFLTEAAASGVLTPGTGLSYSCHGRCQSHILAATRSFLCHGQQRIPSFCLHVQHAKYNLLRRISIVWLLWWRGVGVAVTFLAVYHGSSGFFYFIFL